eukprot:765104-Hanusia_phi.AAC.16
MATKTQVETFLDKAVLLFVSTYRRFDSGQALNSLHARKAARRTPHAITRLACSMATSGTDAPWMTERKKSERQDMETMESP